ncbi:MAG: hypothetical protein Q8N53_16845 [Longimicrobiales bacterium]|nr:hypothetical protein [Longimicrobiales bacterium]
MPVRQRTTRHQRPELSSVQRGLLRDVPTLELLEMAKAEGSNPFKCFGPATEDKLRLLWEAGGAEVLAEWIREHPGTRPSTWWRIVAPTLAGFTGQVPWQTTRKEQRPVLRRLGALEPGE